MSYWRDFFPQSDRLSFTLIVCLAAPRRFQGSFSTPGLSQVNGDRLSTIQWLHTNVERSQPHAGGLTTLPSQGCIMGGGGGGCCCCFVLHAQSSSAFFFLSLNLSYYFCSFPSSISFFEHSISIGYRNIIARNPGAAAPAEPFQGLFYVSDENAMFKK